MGGRRRRRRKHMKTCSLRAKTSVLKWTPEPAAAALLALSASAPHTHTWTHTCIHEGVERVVVEGKKKKKKIYVKYRFPCAPGLLPPPRRLQARTLSFNSLQCYQVMMTTLVSLCLGLSWLHIAYIQACPRNFFFPPSGHILGTLSLIILVFQGRPACLLKLLINTEAPKQTPLCASFLTYPTEWGKKTGGEKQEVILRREVAPLPPNWPKQHQCCSGWFVCWKCHALSKPPVCSRCFVIKIKTPGASWCSTKSQTGARDRFFFSEGYSVRFCALPWRIRTTPVKPCRLPNQ